MKAENLQSLGSAERMMVRWMCGVSPKDRKRSEILYSLLGVQNVAEMVRRGRLRWFGHVERRNGDDWVSACRNVVVAGVRCAGRGRKTCREWLGPVGLYLLNTHRHFYFSQELCKSTIMTHLINFRKVYICN